MFFFSRSIAKPVKARTLAPRAGAGERQPGWPASGGVDDRQPDSGGIIDALDAWKRVLTTHQARRGDNDVGLEPRRQFARTVAALAARSNSELVEAMSIKGQMKI